MKKPGIFAVSVGVSQYARLGRLGCSANDATDMAAVLREGTNPAQVKVLVDAAATKQSILKEFTWLANGASSNDTAILFFSGHGGRLSARADGQGYLCPVDASALDVEQTCISSAELTAALRAIKSERMVVLLDTCYSGGIGEPRGGGLDTGLTDRDVSELIEGSGRVIMAASRPDELAWEMNGMRNGVFTTYLLRGLLSEVARPDGTIWASDLFSYVSRGVRQERRQHPYQKAIGEDFVVIIQRRSAVSSPSLSIVTLPSVRDQRSLRIAMRAVYDRAELVLLCRDLGLSLEDLPGTTLETQMMDLIDYCHRHGRYNQLLNRVRMDRPQIAQSR